MHADDATLIAMDKTSAISKLSSLLIYCNLNKIIHQYTKCWYIVINGTENDKTSLEFGQRFIENRHHIEILGSHLSQS